MGDNPDREAHEFNSRRGLNSIYVELLHEQRLKKLALFKQKYPAKSYNQYKHLVIAVGFLNDLNEI